jgi:hypothetical protein
MKPADQSEGGLYQTRIYACDNSEEAYSNNYSFKDSFLHECEAVFE